MHELGMQWASFKSACACLLCRAMTKSLDSTAVYAWTTLISVLICVPCALLVEGSQLAAGVDLAIAKVRERAIFSM